MFLSFCFVRQNVVRLFINIVSFVLYSAFVYQLDVLQISVLQQAFFVSGNCAAYHRSHNHIYHIYYLFSMVVYNGTTHR